MNTFHVVPLRAEVMLRRAGDSWMPIADTTSFRDAGDSTGAVWANRLPGRTGRGLMSSAPGLPVLGHGRRIPMTVWNKAGHVAGVLVVLVVLAGCGSGGGGAGGRAGGGGGSFAHKPVGHILEAMSHDMSHVRSFGVAGHLTSGGDTVGIDMHITAGGCIGTVKIGRGTARIVSKGSTFWMKPDHAFWRSQGPQQAAGLEQMVGDKWIAASRRSSDLDAFCNLPVLLKDLAASTHGPNKGVVEGTEKVAGHHAVKVVGKDHGDPVVLWVAADGPHHILKIRSGGRAYTKGSSLTFTDFNEPVQLTTPDPSEVVDFG